MRAAGLLRFIIAGLALLWGASSAATSDCRNLPWFRLNAPHVTPGGLLKIDGSFGPEPAGRVFVLRRAADVLFGGPAPGKYVELPALDWRDKQVEVRIPSTVAAAYYELGVRCTDARAAPAASREGMLGFRDLVRVQGDPDSWHEKALLLLDDFPQMRTLHAGLLLAGYAGFVLLFALPFARMALRMRPTVAGLTGAACNFTLAWTFLGAWWNPAALGEELLTWLVFLMILEFLLMHASIVFAEHVMTRGETAARLKTMLLLGGMYSLFAAGISLALRSVWPLLLLWATTLSRFLPALLRGPLSGERESHLARAAPSAVLYLLGAGFCSFYPLPKLGATGAVSGHGGGLWMDEPHRALAFGAFYFFALGLVELATPMPARTDAAGDPGSRPDQRSVSD